MIAIEHFRTLEITIFYSQILSLFIFVAQCKLFIFLKKKFTTDLNSLKDDPFWYALEFDQSDFLSHENQIMVITTLQLTNYMIQSVGLFFIFLYGQDGNFA